MGADGKWNDTAIVRVEGLTGAPVGATDLRAGAMRCRLGAEGTTEVGAVEMIDRG